MTLEKNEVNLSLKSIFKQIILRKYQDETTIYNRNWVSLLIFINLKNLSNKLKNSLKLI